MSRPYSSVSQRQGHNQMPVSLVIPTLPYQARGPQFGEYSQTRGQARRQSTCIRSNRHLRLQRLMHEREMSKTWGIFKHLYRFISACSVHKRRLVRATAYVSSSKQFFYAEANCTHLPEAEVRPILRWKWFSGCSPFHRHPSAHFIRMWY